MLRLPLALAALLVACGDAPDDAPFDAPSETDAPADTGGDTSGSGDAHPYDSAPQPDVLADGVAAPALASGRSVLFFVNGRLSDASTAYATNRIEESRLLGPDAFVYDPAQPGKLLALGRPDYGAVDGYQGRERQKLSTDEIAWHPEHGLYAIHIDPTNDEWILGRWNVADWTTSGQTWSTELWALPVDDDQQHSLYWEYGIEALEFLDGTLHAGSYVDYASDDGGELYAFDMALPPTYDPSQPEDDRFYMAEAPTGPLLELPYAMMWSGDLAQTDDGVFGAINASDPVVLPEDVNVVYAFDLASYTYVARSGTVALSAEDQDIEGLGVVDGVLYGLTVDARVLAIDPATGTATLHDDLGPLFRDREGQVRVRGATTVTLP